MNFPIGEKVSSSSMLPSPEKPIALIPARGGSKRVPRKNLKLFLGEPLISRTIQNLISMDFFAEVFVSTEDDEIARVAQDSGAKVPWLRNRSLADDFTGTHAVVRDFLHREPGAAFLPSQLVCCVYPAAVLLTVQEIAAGFEAAKKHPASAIIGAVENSHPPARLFRRDDSGFGTLFDPEAWLSRTQDFEKTFNDAGQLYWGSKMTWTLSPNASVPRYLQVLPKERAVDIDTEADWLMAEGLFLRLQL